MQGLLVSGKDLPISPVGQRQDRPQQNELDMLPDPKVTRLARQQVAVLV
jgi:hypothetical protein